MYNIRTLPMIHLLGPPEYAIEEPSHVENKADNHKESSLQLKHFDSSTYYQNAPRHIEKYIKGINREVMKKRHILDFGRVKPIVIYFVD